ncbi:kinase-like domain-containing protein [Suillus lakei]|nr:kinase-like domain-containing protein [Suillus lakei]
MDAIWNIIYIYLKEATTITASAKVVLSKGVAVGLNYLHSMNVIHGDLHPANVLIDSSGNPWLTDFGLATVEGEAELQLNSTTAERSFNSRWRAPEVIGIEYDPVRPTFMSDIYSFGSVMFFIISGDIPWKEKKQSFQICIELSKRAAHSRLDNIPYDHWNWIQQCWSWDPGHRPKTAEVLEYIDQFWINNSQDLQPNFTCSEGQASGSSATCHQQLGFPVVQGSREKVKCSGCLQILWTELRAPVYEAVS